MQLVEKQSNLWPRQLVEDDVQNRLKEQQVLIHLGFASFQETQFQASLAEADDAGHGGLLLQAGFNEQQIRNAQERQREAYEEAKADLWFRQLAIIRAIAELQNLGFVDPDGKVNVAGADDAGYRVLLLGAGFTQLQIRDAQRRQREAHEEAQADAWPRQLPEIRKRQMDTR